MRVRRKTKGEDGVFEEMKNFFALLYVAE